MGKRIGWPAGAHQLLLHAALGDEIAAPVAWRHWRATHDLDALDLDDDSRRLLPLVGHNLRASGVLAAEAARVREVTRLAWARNRFLFKSLGEAINTLQQHDIEVLLLKGVPLALQYYPAPGLRPMSDGDFLVRPAQFEAAVTILQSAGWRVEGKALSSPAHHASPFRNAALQEIDLHRFALGECPFAFEDEDFWQDALPLTINGVTTRATNATDSLLMTCVNSVHSPVRWVADAVILLRQNDLDWNRLVRQARSRQLSLVTHEALLYLAREFAAPVPARVLQSLRAAPIARWQKREYRAWKNSSCSSSKAQIRFAAYRRLARARPGLRLTEYLQLLGGLHSRRAIPRWLLTRGWQTLYSRFSGSTP